MSAATPTAPKPMPTPPPAPKPALPLELARLRASLLRKEVESLPPAARGARVRKALSGEPSLVGGLEPEVWAGISPDAISVYDATALAAFAPDLPVAVRDLVASDEAETAPGPTIDPRIRRFAAELGTAANQALVLLHPTGAIVVVARVEDRIDDMIKGLARAGSTLARLEADLIPDGPGLPLDLEDSPSMGAALDRSEAGIKALGRHWRRAAAFPGSSFNSAELEFYARFHAPAFPASPERLHLDVPCGSRCGSKRTKSVAYVQDFDMEVGNHQGPLKVIVGTIEAGLFVQATHRPFIGEAPGSLVVNVSWSELVEPVPTFTTSLASGSNSPAVTIDLPELRLQRATITMPAVAGAAVYLPFKINGVVVRVAAIEPIAPPTVPLVRRIAAGATSRAASGWGYPSSPFVVSLARTPTNAARYSGVADANVSLTVDAGLGSVASASETTPVSYIAGFDLDIASRSAIADPRIATISPGFEVRVHARTGAGADVVACGALRLTQLDVPMRIYAFPDGGGRATIQLPRVHQVVEAFAGTWAPGATHRWSLTGTGGAKDATTIDVRRGDATEPAPATK